MVLRDERGRSFVRWSTPLPVVDVATGAADVSSEHATVLVREDDESGWTGA
jgi:hypothetical protein